MTTRPTLLGYVRADALSCAEELAAATEDLAIFASTEGFVLGTVYTERDAAGSAAFHALLNEVKKSGVRTVVVPTLDHLEPVGTPTALRPYLELHQAHVLTVSGTTPQTSGADVLTPASASVPLSTSTAAPRMLGR